MEAPATWELTPESVPCERCGTELVLIEWDGKRMWMERLGWALADRGQVWITHEPDSCTKARERRLG